MSDASGNLKWTVIGKGHIEGEGSRVTYVAPEEVGVYAVTVQEGTNVGTVKVTVLPQGNLAENTVWEVFTNRSSIWKLAFSKGKKILWVGTRWGGLEQRDAMTGQIIRVFTNMDGLPSNEIMVLETDDSGGVWIGTSENGLVYLNANRQLTIYATDNSELPHNKIQALLSDDQGGVWIGTFGGGLAHYSANAEWTIYSTKNSGLPTNGINALEHDGNGGLWVAINPIRVGSKGTGGGVAHLSSDGEWHYDTVNANWLETSIIQALASDNNGGLWIGTFNGEIAYRNSNGQWNQKERVVIGNIYALLSDDQNGLWIGTFMGGLLYRNANSEITVYKKNEFQQLIVSSLLKDSRGGLWIGVARMGESLGEGSGLFYRNVNGDWDFYQEDNTKIPSNWVTALESDAKGGIWIGTENGLAYRSANGRWTIYDTADLGNVEALLTDGRDGVWLGSMGGLTYINFNGDKTNYDNFVMPDSQSAWVSALAGNSQGGLWIGGYQNNFSGMGVAHRNIHNEWTMLGKDNAWLLYHYINTLLSDGNGGLWIAGYSSNKDIAHLDAEGKWTIHENILPLSHTQVLLENDGNQGLWIGTFGGLSHYHANGETTNYQTENSALSTDSIMALESDGHGGVWVATATISSSWDGRNEGGLVHFNAEGESATYNANDAKWPITLSSIFILLSDDKGGLWLGVPEGLAYMSSQSEWKLYNPSNSPLPAYNILALETDGQGGVWIGAADYIYIDDEFVGSGLTHLSASGEWTLYNVDNSELPHNDVLTLKSDNDGIWIGTGSGIAYHSVDGEWTIYNTNNAGLPSNAIELLEHNENGGVWIKTVAGGFAFRSSNGDWNVHREENTMLTYTKVNVLESDANGGVWIGTSSGLANYSTENQWSVYNTDNSALPSDNITTLESDSNKGLWIGTDEGLAHQTVDDKWTVYNQDNSELPSNQINALKNDDHGGIWIGTADAGIVYRSVRDQWILYDLSNSGLPDNEIKTLESDGSGGLWVGTRYNGLAHLTFSQKRTLINTIDDQAIQNNFLTEKRAAILIHPRGQSQDTGYNQEIAVDFMATYAYHTLHARGYDNNEIYFLSYKPDIDFNGDAIADFNVVDAPVKLADFQSGNKLPRDLSIADIDQAFEWAKTQGPLDQPLLVIFIDHGLENKLLLDPFNQEILSGEKFKALLDDYQTTTDNKIVVILEACHTGTLVPILAAPNRTIVSSTGHEEAYYNDLGRTSFLRFYFNQLRRGDNLHDSWQTVDHTFDTYGLPFIQQNPQLNDSAEGVMAQSLCLNGCFALPGVPTLTPQIATHQINAGQTIELKVATQINSGRVRRVWASIITPDVNSQRNEQGYSHLPTPVTYLQEIADGQWQGNYTFDANATPSDEYTFTFKAEDNTKFVTESTPITITLGKNQQAFFNPNTNTLHIPAVTVGTETYQANLILHRVEPKIIFELDSIKPATETESVSSIQFNPSTGKVQIPLVEIGSDTFSATLQLIPETSPLQFRVESIKLLY